MAAAIPHLASKSAVFGLKGVGLPSVLVTYEFCSIFKTQISYSDPGFLLLWNIKE